MSFTLPTASPVRLALFDASGRRVATLLDRSSMPAGTHRVAIDTATLDAGVYFARIEAGLSHGSRKVMVVR